MPDTLPEPENLEWLVERRSENQRQLLELYRLYCTHGDLLKVESEHEVRARGGRLFSAAFSLWRAVFLADRNPDVGARVDQIKWFLGRLVADNAISYPQDKYATQWSLLYYLYYAQMILESDTLPHSKEFREKYAATIELGTRKCWDLCHKYLAIEVATLKLDLERLTKHR